MFDLRLRIEEWRREMGAAGIRSPAILDELEAHLRDDMESQMSSGISQQDAFEAGALRLGRAKELKAEFEKHDGLLRRRMTLAAGSVFILSFFLPALNSRFPADAGSGFSCLGLCWKIFVQSSDRLYDFLSPGWFYFSGFVAANAAFLFLWIANVALTRASRIRLWLTTITFVYAGSWFVMNLIFFQLSIAFGYFVWLLSFAALALAHLAKWQETGVLRGWLRTR